MLFMFIGYKNYKSFILIGQKFKSLILIGHYFKILDSDWIIFRWGRRGGGGGRRGGRGGVNWSINQSIQKIIFIGNIHFSHKITANDHKCLIASTVLSNLHKKNSNLPFIWSEYFIFLAYLIQNMDKK